MRDYPLQCSKIVFGSAMIAILLAVSGGVAHAAAGIPKIIHYQGRLLDSSGNLLGSSGTDYCFRFSLYDDATVGAPDMKLWPSGTPSDMTVNVANGVFAVEIGDTDAGGDTLDFNFSDTDTVYLNIEVATVVGGSCGGGDESYETLGPRQRVDSAAYALSAGSVLGTNQSAIGTTTVVSDTMLTLEGTSTSAVPLAIRRFTGQVSHLFNVLSELGASIFTINANGNVGVGTSTPYKKLSVAGDVVADSYVATTSATSTFVGGIRTNLLNVTAGSASSTFGNGIDLSSGCFSVGGICVLGGSAGFLSLSDTPSSYTSNGLVYGNGTSGLTQSSKLTFDGTTLTSELLSLSSTTATSTFLGNAEISGNASTSDLYVSNSIAGAGLTSCNATSSKLTYNGTTGQFGCADDQGAEAIIDAYDSTGGATINTTPATLNIDATRRIDDTYTLSGNEVTIYQTGLYLVTGTLTAKASGTLGTSNDSVNLQGQASTTGSFSDVVGARCSDGVIDKASSTASCVISWVATYASGDQIRLQYFSDIGGFTITTLANESGIVITKLSDNGADLAELYPTNDATIQPGELVSSDKTLQDGVLRSTDESGLLGIVSTKPGLVLGGNETEHEAIASPVVVALSGRVPAFVSAENGPIEAGDMITASTKHPGVGMKATSPGRVVGMALEGYEGTSQPDAIGTITVFVDPHWYGGDPGRFADWLSRGVATDTPANDATVLTGLRKLVHDVLRTFGVLVEKGTTTFSNLFADTITVNNADVRNAVLASAHINDLYVGHSFEMRDQGTGKTYCMVLENGTLTPIPGTCTKNSGASSENATQTSGAPVITILGNNPAAINVGDTYTDLGVTVTDDKDENIGVSIFVDGTSTRQVTIDTNVPGEHTVRYRVTDTDDNSSEADRIVIVGTTTSTVSTDETDTDTVVAGPDSTTAPDTDGTDSDSTTTPFASPLELTDLQTDPISNGTSLDSTTTLNTDMAGSEIHTESINSTTSDATITP